VGLLAVFLCFILCFKGGGMRQVTPHDQPITISQIEERLRRLPPDKLAVVFDFVSYLADRQPTSEALQTMLASEAVLSRDWLTPEEDAAWQDL
jgi:hypothetical protein